MSFDKIRFFKNLDELIAQNSLKISEIEKKIGISAGYFSRLRRTENESVPSIEIICKLAELLQVSIDALLHFDFSVGTYNLNQLNKMIDKVISDTNKGKIYWIKETGENVYNNECFTNEKMFLCVDKHLVEYPEEGVSFEMEEYKYFNMNNGMKTDLGPCYRGEYQDGRIFMLMGVYMEQRLEWDVYMIVNEQVTEENYHEEEGCWTETYIKRKNYNLYTTSDVVSHKLLPTTQSLIHCIERNLGDVRMDLGMLSAIETFLEKK